LLLDPSRLLNHADKYIFYPLIHRVFCGGVLICCPTNQEKLTGIQLPPKKYLPPPHFFVFLFFTPPSELIDEELGQRSYLPILKYLQSLSFQRLFILSALFG